MGVKAATTTVMATSTAMTLTDDILRQLTEVLQGCPMIRSMSLVQSTKLGSSRRDSAIAHFIRNIGRKLAYLNLSGVLVRSEDLLGLVPGDQDQEVSSLETLILNKSLIDDDCAPWISSCKSLEALEVSETRISGRYLFLVVKSMITDETWFQRMGFFRLSTLVPGLQN